MILRYLLIILIILTLASVFVLPENFFELTIFDNSKKQAISTRLPQIYPYPVPSANYNQPPQVTAKSAIIIDAASGISLFEKDPDIRHLPASTTKLMTALVALEKCSPETPVLVSQVNTDGTQMGLSEGDIVTAQNLLYGLLLASGNDAAYTLANACSASYSHFITLMNQKAEDLAMDNTHFANPAGFDSQFQYSTARDLAKLAKVAIANPLIAKIVATQSTIVTDISGQKTYYLENVNKLLGQVQGIKGIKTGHTEGSLEILISETTREGHSIIAVVLGSLNRFEESKELIEWAFKNYSWNLPS